MSDDQVASVCLAAIGIALIYLIYKLVDKTL